MRIGSKLVHNLDNQQIVIMDESTGNEITFSLHEYKTLLSNGCTILHEHQSFTPRLLVNRPSDPFS